MDLEGIIIRSKSSVNFTLNIYFFSGKKDASITGLLKSNLTILGEGQANTAIEITLIYGKQDLVINQEISFQEIETINVLHNVSYWFPAMVKRRIT